MRRGDGGESGGVPPESPGVLGEVRHGGGPAGAIGALDHSALSEGEEEDRKYASSCL